MNNEIDGETRENKLDEDGNSENENNTDSLLRHEKKKKKRQHFMIMSQSDQTDDDRRLLRRRQRDLHRDMVVGGDDGHAAKTWREQNNHLWGKVRFTREAVLDSDNVDLIANKAARQAEKVIQIPRYDAICLAQALLKKGTVHTGSSSQFNWRGLGIQVGVCYDALPPNVSFLYGSLDAEYTPKERRERQHKQQPQDGDNEEEEHPEDTKQVGKKKSDGNELSAVEKHISIIHKTLKKRSREEWLKIMSEKEIDDDDIGNKKPAFAREKSHVHAVNCLFNPKSFTQTIENIFHFSFLVKGSVAGITTWSFEEAKEYGRVPGPVIRPETKDSDTILPPEKQAIVSLNMKDWRDMCKAFDVDESDVPHRVGGKVAT